MKLDMQNDISMEQRLQKQVDFMIEMDLLKNVIRRTYINHGERLENTAEHSWQVALMAIVLAEYANETVEISHVIRMLLIHDIVEIMAGDTYIYQPDHEEEQVNKEAQAAGELFGMLPADQEQEFRALWDEFEAMQTPESRFAKALDRLMPTLHNYTSEGKSWLEHGVTRKMVEENIEKIGPGSQVLWEYAHKLLEDAFQKGYLAG
jgi:putative hydrolase of HD superfamily